MRKPKQTVFATAERKRPAWRVAGYAVLRSGGTRAVRFDDAFGCLVISGNPKEKTWGRERDIFGTHPLRPALCAVHRMVAKTRSIAQDISVSYLREDASFAPLTALGELSIHRIMERGDGTTKLVPYEERCSRGHIIAKLRAAQCKKCEHPFCPKRIIDRGY